MAWCCRGRRLRALDGVPGRRRVRQHGRHREQQAYPGQFDEHGPPQAGDAVAQAAPDVAALAG